MSKTTTWIESLITYNNEHIKTLELKNADLRVFLTKWGDTK